MNCKKCGHKLLLGKVWIETVIPDDEPYEADGIIHRDEIDVNDSLLVHYCEDCQIIHDIWDDEKHLPSKGEDDERRRNNKTTP